MIEAKPENRIGDRAYDSDPLNKDCPRPRPVQLPFTGNNIIALSEVGGLHHAMNIEPRKIAEPSRCLSCPQCVKLNFEQ